MSRFEFAVDQIRTARRYSEKLIDNVDPGDWFRQPSEGVTHVAWQVGLWAMAVFRLAVHSGHAQVARMSEQPPVEITYLPGLLRPRPPPTPAATLLTRWVHVAGGETRS